MEPAFGEAGITPSMFERAVKVALKPPGPGTPEVEVEHFHAATGWVQSLAAQPDAAVVCTQLLSAVTAPTPRFIAAQTLEAHLRREGAAYAALPADTRRGLHGALLDWTMANVVAGSAGAELKNKLAVVFALLIKRDFPHTWPTAFAELYTTLCGGGGTDFFLRVCAMVQQEVVERGGASSPGDRTLCAGVKDAMREGAVTELVAAWHGIITANEASAPGVAALALGVVSQYVSWIDVRLVVGGDWITMMHSLLGHRHEAVRAGVLRLLMEILRKGMDHLSRLTLMKLLGVVDVVTALVGTAEAITSVDMEGTAPTTASVPEGYMDDCHASIEALTGGPQHYAATYCHLLYLAACSLLEAGDALTPLLAPPPDTTPAGVPLSGGGEGGSTTDVVEWTAWALRSVLDACLMVCASASPSLALHVLPVWTEAVTYFHREMRLGGGGGGSGGGVAPGSPPPFAGLGAGNPPPPSTPAGLTPLALPPAHGGGGGIGGGDSTASLSAAGGGSGLSLHSLVAMARARAEASGTWLSGGAASGSAAELAAAACAAGVGFALDAGMMAAVATYAVTATAEASTGRPAGVSMAEFIPRLLDLVIMRYPYPADYDFGDGAGEGEGEEGEGEEGEGEGEGGDGLEQDESAAVRHMRDALRRVFIGVVRAAPEASLTHLTGTVLSPDHIAALPRMAWNEAEAALALLYLLGEGASSMTSASVKAGSGVVYDLLVAVVGCGCLASHTHHEVILTYLEVVTRYALLAVARPDTLREVLGAFVGATGLHHPRPLVRSRSAYLLSRYVKTLMRETPPTTSAAIVQPHADDLLTGIAEFLSVPFVPRDGAVGGGGASRHRGHGPTPSVTSINVSSTACASRTRGTSGLGSEDQQFLYEIVGLLLGAPWLGVDKRVSYTDAVMTPLITHLDEGIEYLVSAGGGAGPTPSTGPSGSVRVDTSTWSADLLSDVAVWLVRIINALAFLTKGYGNVSAVPALVDIQEKALMGTMRALSILPAHPHVRNRAVFFLQRMVDCLDARLLVYFDTLAPLLLSGSTPDDMTQTLNLFTSMTRKLHAPFAAVMSPHFIAVAAHVFDVLPPMPTFVPAPPSQQGMTRPRPSTGGGGGGGGGSGGGGSGGTRRGGRARGGASTTNATSITLAASDSAIPTAAPVNSEEMRARTDLQRAFTMFLHAIIVDGVSVTMFTSPECAPHLTTVLTAITTMVTASTDMAIAKSLTVTATLLVRAWLPITPYDQAMAAASGTSGTPPTVNTVSHTIASTYGLPPTPDPTTAATLPTCSDYWAAGSPSPLPHPDVTAGFIMYCAENWLRLPFSAPLSPWWHDNDAQSLLCVNEAACLLLTLLIHLPAHAGQYAATSSIDADSLCTHLVTTVLPSMGVDATVAASVGETALAALRLSPMDAFRHAALYESVLAALTQVRLATQASLDSGGTGVVGDAA